MISEENNDERSTFDGFPGKKRTPWCVHNPNYRFVGLVISIRVHWGQQVDSGVLDEVHNAWVPSQVFLAHELHQQKDQLPSKHFIPMSSCNVVEFWLPCGTKTRSRVVVRGANQISIKWHRCQSATFHSRTAGEMFQLHRWEVEMLLWKNKLLSVAILEQAYVLVISEATV